MSQYDSTTTGQILKDVFDKQTVRDTVYDKNPFLGMLKKQQTGGEDYNFVVRYELPGGRSRTFTTAAAGKKPGKFVRFAVPMVKDYNITSFDRLFMSQTSKDEYAFLDAASEEVKKLLKQLARSLSMSLYRNIGGAVGTVSTSGATSITLADIEEVANFSVGDVLTSAANDGSTSTDTLDAGLFTVTAVNRDTGVLTGTGSGGWSAPAAARYLFKDGDFQSSIAGIQSWCPGTAPISTDSFYGANRYPDPTRLAGIRVTATGDLVSEAIQKACARLGREGAAPDTVLMSHSKMRDLLIELGAKVEYESSGAEDATVGFKGVRVVTPSGSVTCYADHNCPSKRLFVTSMSAWKLLYCGSDVPELQDDDGSILFRESTSDGYEVRASYYANLACLETNVTANVQLEA